MATEYDLWLLHPATGSVIANISEFLTLNYTKVANDRGAFTLTLPRSFDLSLVAEDSRIVVYRKPPNGNKMLDFCGLVRKIEKPTRGGVLTYSLGGFDLNDLLKRRIVAYNAGTAYTQKSAVADNMMKAIVRENLGALCSDATRDLTAFGFTVQADTSLGTSVEKGFSRRNVLEVLKEIADASHQTETTCVYFGIVPLNTGWACEFRTNIVQWGVDHRHPSGAAGSVLFGLEYANVAEASRTIDYSDEITFAYAGGPGEESQRVIKTASDAVRMGASPFNRCEIFADSRSDEIETQTQDTADTAVRSGRPKNLFSGKVLNAGQLYGRDWGFGDYVTGVYLGEKIDCRVDAVTVSIANGVDNIDVTLRSET